MEADTLVGSPRSRPSGQRTRLYRGAGGAVLLVVALMALVELLPAGAAVPDSAPTGASFSRSSILAGPGGRVALTSWALRRDPGNQGLRAGWSRGGFYGAVVSVPHIANALPVTGPAALRSYAGSIAWYRTAFSTPREGTYAIRFESVNHLATVWLDGHLLGSHLGSYLPFEFRTRVPAGPHTLVVRADWRDPVAQSREGFHRTWFNFGGIDREVSVRAIGPSELQAPALYTSLSPGPSGGLRATVEITVLVRNDAASRPITPSGLLRRGSQTIPLSFGGQTIATGHTALLSARVTVDDPALWSPSHPNLYELALAIDGESTYYAHVGLRELSWSGGHLHLNGQPLVLHGASLQEDARGHGDGLTPADQDALVSELKAIGANATRSQHPLDQGLLDRLDAAGILMWQGVGPVDSPGDWTSTTPALMAAAERRVRTSVRQAQLHPSIIAWNLANEVSGNGHSGGQTQYVERMAAWVHRSDPGRMVAIDVWGDHPPSVAGPLYADVDAIGETNYAGWYNGALASAPQISAMIRSRLAAMHRTFAGKVQIISEFGAEANDLNGPRAPGSYSFQAALIARHIRMYSRDRQLSGMLIWDLRDFALTPTFAGGSITRVVPGIRIVRGINQKGLFSYEQQPKLAVASVAGLYGRMPRD